MKMEKITVESEDVRCLLCAKTTVDEGRLGPMYRLDDVVCHYFCMLFSSGLPQNGVNDDDGILRFLPEDIKEEVYRVADTGLNCIFCQNEGAFVGCCINECRNIWHFACGAENGINHQFFGKYEAFCAQHCKLPLRIQQRANRNITTTSCPICLCLFTPRDIPLFGSCCATSVFHRSCIQKYALSSGSFFKCPTCSKRTFKRDAERQGVFVPEQDASWEKEPNAFRDLLRRPLRCDVIPCQCPDGQKFRDIDADGDWYIVRCVLCGGTCTHVNCGQVTNITSWTCDVCKPLADASSRSDSNDVDSDSFSDETKYSSNSDDDLFVAIPRKITKKENSSDSDDDLFVAIPRKITKKEDSSDSDDDLFVAIPRKITKKEDSSPSFNDILEAVPRKIRRIED